LILNSKPLHPKQYEICSEMFESNVKYNLVRCGRNFGKTVSISTGVERHVTESKPTTVYVFSHTYGAVMDVFEPLFSDFSEAGMIINSVQGKSIYLINGSKIKFYSFDKYENIRGKNFADYLFVDEARNLSDFGWNSVLKQCCYSPKKVYFFTTPKGKNWIYTDIYLKTISDPKNYKDYHGTTFDNPTIADFEKESMLSHEGTDLFLQENMAEFIDSGGEVFQNLDSLFVLEKFAEKSAINYGGVDIAKEVDKTSIFVLNQKKECCYQKSFNGVDFEEIANCIIEVIKKFNCTFTIESNSIGAAVIELIKKKGYFNKLNIFHTNPTSKPALIQKLRYCLQQKELKLPKTLQQTKKELEIYEYKLLPSGAIGYSAPKGAHDDDVMALGFAVNEWDRMNSKKTTSIFTV